MTAASLATDRKQRPPLFFHARDRIEICFIDVQWLAVSRSEQSWRCPTHGIHPL
jgi:hypothetical protein